MTLPVSLNSGFVVEYRAGAKVLLVWCDKKDYLHS